MQIKLIYAILNSVGVSPAKIFLEGTMNITEVRVRLIKKEEGKLKAVASVTFDDCFVVHDVKIIEGSEGCFIAMPSKRTPEGEYKDIVHPLNTETREQLAKCVLEEYEKALAANV